MDLYKEWNICSCVKSFEIFNDICSDALADTLLIIYVLDTCILI